MKRAVPQKNKLKGSFRDPDSFVYTKKGGIFRQINKSYQDSFQELLNSGLYDLLVSSGLLLAHKEINESEMSRESYKVIKPEQLPFISYPYEWSFSQLKSASLVVLQILKMSLEYGMILKDGSAYNIQFYKGKPVWIDTPSFEKYEEGIPWFGYGQFCRHFLAPLSLMSYKDLRLGYLMREYIDGIPLDLASSLLPAKSFLNLSLLLHLHLHSKSEKYSSRLSNASKNLKISKKSLLELVNNLESVVKGLKYPKSKSLWQEYYKDTIYSKKGFNQKLKFVDDSLRKIKPKTVWDLGANTGLFSVKAENTGAFVLAADSDPASVELNYLECTKNNRQNILPLIIDLTNPSPAIGWANEERMTLEQRGPADTIFALALIHHLGITNNIPFQRIAEFFFGLCKNLIIEFIPREDPNVQIMLKLRKDIFLEYGSESFETQFKKYFTIKEKIAVSDTMRTLYRMERKG